MSSAQSRRCTADELLGLRNEKHLELFEGELFELSSSALASLIGGQLACGLHDYSERHGGFVFPTRAGLQCFSDDPECVLKPRASYFAEGKLVHGVPKGWLRQTPDLVAEVRSRNDQVSLDRKVQVYLEAGIRMVWVACPESRTVQVYRPSGESSLLHADDTLIGEDILPGFECRVGELFPPK
ncbi:MAG: Uma2 family endonuclease [Planctomycetota bacterium]